MTTARSTKKGTTMVDTPPPAPEKSQAVASAAVALVLAATKNDRAALWLVVDGLETALDERVSGPPAPLLDPAQLQCPASPGDTHYLVPKSGRMVCRYCTLTTRQLQDAAARS